MGTYITEHFAGYGEFVGKVVQQSGGVCHVVYHDGDHDEMTPDDVRDLAIPSGRRVRAIDNYVLGGMHVHATGFRKELRRWHSASGSSPPPWKRHRGATVPPGSTGGVREYYASLPIVRDIYDTLGCTPGDGVLAVLQGPLSDLVKRELTARRRARDSATENTKLKKLMASQHDQGRRNAEALVTKLCGPGFDSSRTRRRHANSWMQRIVKAYPDDVRKQCQAAADIADRFAVKTTPGYKDADGNVYSDEQVQTALAIATSLREMNTELRRRFPAGRYPNGIRTLVRASGLSISLPNKLAGADRRARLVRTTKKLLLQERARWVRWLDDKGCGLVSLRGAIRSNKFPPEWCQRVHHAWLDPDVTRASERTRDDLIGPDGTRVRKHLLETRVGVAIARIKAICTAHFHADFEYEDGRKRRDGFTAKSTFIRSLRPFNVVNAFGNVNTSLCRRHMQLEYSLTAVYNWQRLLRSKGIVPTSQKMLPRNVYALRRLLTCPRTDDRGCPASCPCRTGMAIDTEVKQQARDPEQEVPESDKGMPALTDDDGGGDKADAASKANAEFGDASALLSTANGDDYGTPPSTPSAVESAATSTGLAPTPRRHGHVDLHVQRRTWIRQRTKRRALETTSSDEEISSGSDELFGSDGEDDVLAWCRFNQKHSGRPTTFRGRRGERVKVRGISNQPGVLKVQLLRQDPLWADTAAGRADRTSHGMALRVRVTHADTVEDISVTWNNVYKARDPTFATEQQGEDNVCDSATCNMQAFWDLPTQMPASERSTKQAFNLLVRRLLRGHTQPIDADTLAEWYLRKTADDLDTAEALASEQAAVRTLIDGALQVGVFAASEEGLLAYLGTCHELFLPWACRRQDEDGFTTSQTDSGLLPPPGVPNNGNCLHWEHLPPHAERGQCGAYLCPGLRGTEAHYHVVHPLRRCPRCRVKFCVDCFDTAMNHIHGRDMYGEDEDKPVGFGRIACNCPPELSTPVVGDYQKIWALRNVRDADSGIDYCVGIEGQHGHCVYDSDNLSSCPRCATRFCEYCRRLVSNGGCRGPCIDCQCPAGSKWPAADDIDFDVDDNGDVDVGEDDVGVLGGGVEGRDDSTPFDNLECVQGSCDRCRDLRLLVGADGNGGLLASNELDQCASDMTIKWQKWEQAPTSNPDKDARYDFRTKKTNVHAIIEDMKTWWHAVGIHHDDAKWFARDKKWKRRHFPRGHVHCVQDFAMNGDFCVKNQHASRFFESWQYTLYGAPFDSYVEDRTDIPDAEKAALIEMFDAEGLPHIITDSIIIITEDTLHDVSAVQHFNTKCIVPLLKKLIKDLKMVEVTSDGAPDQYYNKNLVYWVSTCKAKLGVSYDWTIGVASHGKDMADGENGGAKKSVNTANMEHESGVVDRHSSIESVPEVVSHLRAKYQVRTDNVLKQRGKGIYRRHILHVGLKDISRRLPIVQPLQYDTGRTNSKGARIKKGIKSLHQFTDVGIPGTIVARRRPCHFCRGCAEVDTAAMHNDCCHKARCGPTYTIKIKASAATAVLYDLRCKGKEIGVKLAEEAEAGDYIAVESPDACLPFFMGEVETGVVITRDNDDGSSDDGEDDRQDAVISVRRWMPLVSGGGGNVYERVDGEDNSAVVMVRCVNIRALIPKKAADDDKDFAVVRQRRRRRQQRQDLLQCTNGTCIKYLFKDKPKTWYKGTVIRVHNSGVNKGMAHVKFDDGDTYFNLPVSADDIAQSGGNKMEIVSGGVPTAAAQVDAQQRRLSAKQKKAIAASIVPPTGR